MSNELNIPVMGEGTDIKSIPVYAEGSETGNVSPVLHEVRHALQHLAETGEGSIIDLRSLPMAPGEEERIDAFLGEGEVSATITALGPTKIIETRFPGVWIVTHYNTAEEVMGRFIEVTTVLALLTTPSEDLEDSSLALVEALK